MTNIRLGIRTSTTEIRYAVIDADKKEMLNKTDHRVKIAKNLNDSEIFQWLYKEIEEIIKQYSVNKAIICENAYGRDSKALRLSNRLDAIIVLALANHKILSVIKVLNKKEDFIMEYAETHIGKTEKYWNKSIASCIVLALGGN